MISFNKLGFVHKPTNISQLWQTHAMAPTAIEIENAIRVFVGGWDLNGISRIFYMDVDKERPQEVVSFQTTPVLNIGPDGAFDENGVFPGHIFRFNNLIYMHYTGFQLGYKIPHYNFGGLATSTDNGITFKRIYNSPVLDRSDEGLSVRAGASTITSNECFRTVYSAGSSWIETGGKLRPCYDIFLIDSEEFTSYPKFGKKIISADKKIEHGLGRPQIINLKNKQYVFYTRRILGMRYSFGYAVQNHLGIWERFDDTINITHGDGFDSEMLYFPSIVQLSSGKIFMFYSGNGFGRDGLGVCELHV